MTAYASEAVSILKTTGMTGVKIISAAPLTFVGVTYLGSTFFGYFSSVAGNNPAGSVLNFTSYVLSRPMRGVELVLNGLILRPLSKVVSYFKWDPRNSFWQRNVIRRVYKNWNCFRKNM